MKKNCPINKSTLKKIETGADILWFSLETLLHAIMITSTVIVTCLYIIFDGNLTNMLTDLLAMGDEKIKDVSKTIFVPILFTLFAFRSLQIMNFRKLKKEYEGSCREMDAAKEINVTESVVNFEEKLNEVTVREHIIITGETGFGRTSRIRDLINNKNLNNDSTLLIAFQPLSIWLDLEKLAYFKTSTFSDEVSLENFKTIIIDEATNLDNCPALKKAVLDSFREDKAKFIISFIKESDSIDFFKKNEL